MAFFLMSTGVDDEPWIGKGFKASVCYARCTTVCLCSSSPHRQCTDPSTSQSAAYGDRSSPTTISTVQTRTWHGLVPDSHHRAHLLVRRLRLGEDVGVQAEAAAAIVRGSRLRRAVVSSGCSPLFLYQAARCEGRCAGAGAGQDDKGGPGQQQPAFCLMQQ